MFIEEPRPQFPYVCLTVSGGHTQLDLVHEGMIHESIGRTRDDAAGEAFDKVARMLGLGYPGGPEIDRLADAGDPAFIDFPRTRLQNERGLFDFSFSGIKTSVLYTLTPLTPDDRDAYLMEHRKDLAASFQQAVVDVLTGGLRDAAKHTGASSIAIVGGVSANSQLRRAAQAMADESELRLFIPKLKYSMDNAAMIAVVGNMKYLMGRTDSLDLTVEPALSL